MKKTPMTHPKDYQTKQMSDIEEVKKAQIFLLNTHIDDVVLNAKEYPENTKENAKEWIYLSSVLKAYSNQQQQTIDNLTKEVEELRATYKKDVDNLNSKTIVPLRKENTKLKEVMQIILNDGYATESSINFNVMTGRHYFDLIKQLLTKQQ